MAPGNPRRDRGLEHGGGASAVLQRHGGQRNESGLGPRGGEQRIVDGPAPGFAFRRRQFVTEHIDPAATDLAVDALLLQPSEPCRDVAQRLRYRPRRFVFRECEGEAAALFDQPDRRETQLFAADHIQQVGWNQMGVGIDDHCATTSSAAVSRLKAAEKSALV